MVKVVEEVGVYKVMKYLFKIFYLVIIVGVFILIVFVFYIIVIIGIGIMFFGMVKLVGGICFFLGLIFCVVCGADFFIFIVLIVVVKVSGCIIWGQLVKNWLNVYFGNLVGVLLFVFLMWFFGEYMIVNG